MPRIRQRELEEGDLRLARRKPYIKGWKFECSAKNKKNTKKNIVNKEVEERRYCDE